MITLEQNLGINSKSYLIIIKLLKSAGQEARVVGGAVRDALLGVPSSDIDIATDATPDEVIELFTQHNIKIIPTGIKFGTVTAIIKGESFEITTLRADLDCDGRHAKVVYSKDFAEDAARRDFTINALSYCPITHEIYDYFGGIKDLESKRVVFIGDAAQRIKEDYLRILRFFRFSCRFAKEIDAEALAACVTNKDKLQLLSKERVKSELDLLLLLDGSPDILESIYKAGILEYILPISDYNKKMHVKALEVANLFGSRLELSIIYAILFNAESDISFKKLLTLKFSRAEASIIRKLLELGNIADKTTIVSELKSIWLENNDYLLYFLYISLIIDNKSIYYLYNKLKHLKIPVCPVDGHDLLLEGYSGQKLGASLSFIKKIWIESDFSLSRSQLIDLVKNS